VAEPLREGTPVRAGERAVANAAVRAVAEIVGKLGSLVLFAVLARVVGPSDLGDFVFALAWAEVTLTPVGLGIDRYLLRRLAEEPSSLGDYLFNAFGLKLSRSIPVVAVSFVVVNLLGYDAQTCVAVYVLTVGLLMDSLDRTLNSVFNAAERGGLVAAGILVQRLSAAALGLAALAAGLGVVAVCVTYSIGAALRLGLSLVLLARRLELPSPRFPAWARRELRSRGFPYAVQDIFGLVLARFDVVILSWFATSAAVGTYGAAYRLFEATLFLSISLYGAFAAQYTYLGLDTRPTVGLVFSRSVKLSLALLVPCAVAFGLLAEPLCRLFFGAELESAAEPLRIIAPIVVLHGIIVLGGSLVVARVDPRPVVVATGIAAALNLGLNLALIPSLEGNGAALAMLVAEAVLAGALLVIAVRVVGGVRVIPMVAAPGLAGAALAAVLLPLGGTLWAAVIAGAAIYIVVYVIVDRRLSPGDIEAVGSMIRRRVPSRRRFAEELSGAGRNGT
jgi:O-antigen/teichoic acid export membrane protein